jgi:hypothetical protein
LEESQCIELEKEDLVPDHSKDAIKRYNELIQRGRPFTMNEIWFLGAIECSRFPKSLSG